MRGVVNDCVIITRFRSVIKRSRVSFNRAVGIQAIMQLLQKVVTYASPVEAFATGIKNFDR